MTSARKYAFTVIFGFTVTSLVMLSYHRRPILRQPEQVTREPRKVFEKEVGTGSSREERHQQWTTIFHRREGQEKNKRLPDVIGLGVKKCGTGALIHFLGQHPLVKLPNVVETFFFNYRYRRGLWFYKMLMPKAFPDQLIMEKTPNYFFSTKVVDKIKRDLPGVKLILSLCNPMKRAFSDFVHQRYHKHKDDNGTYFADAFHEKANSFVEQYSRFTDYDDAAESSRRACANRKQMCPFSKGMYHNSMRLWRESFNRSQLLVLNGDLWITDPGLLIERIQEFLGIPQLITREDFVKSPESGFFCLNRWWNDSFKAAVHKRGETSEKVGDDEELFCLGSGKGRTRNGVRSMYPETYQKLRSFYDAYNNKLYNILGENMGW